MKFFSCSLLLTLILAATVVAQSVVVTSKKITYTRPEPMVDFKKNFTVNYPKVKAATPALSRKIESTLSYLKVLGLNIREEMRDVQWLEEADYEVGYNARGILSITLSMSGSGAYPSMIEKAVVVDLKTGNRIGSTDAFIRHGELAALIKQKQRIEIEGAIKEIKEDPENSVENNTQLFEKTDFKVEDLNEFSIDENGVTFIYDYGFPHVIEALEPDGRFKFSWNEIKKFIKPNGPFEKFLRK